MVKVVRLRFTMLLKATYVADGDAIPQISSIQQYGLLVQILMHRVGAQASGENHRGLDMTACTHLMATLSSIAVDI